MSVIKFSVAEFADIASTIRYDSVLRDRFYSLKEVGELARLKMYPPTERQLDKAIFCWVERLYIANALAFEYQYGSFAARVRFSNQPVSGPDGDQIVETFFTIAPWQSAIYSELDFEYLANGGWGKTGPRMWMTSWDTVKKNDHSDAALDLGGGWHNLLVTATADEAIYYVDGVQQGGPHGMPFAPKSLMAIDFNLWFIQPGEVGTPRRYIEQIDWVYHAKDVILTEAQVDEAVKRLRGEGIGFANTIP